jgi:hypothetical protein
MAVDLVALRAWVEDSCAAQGVQVVVTDPGLIAQVGVLLRGRGAAGQPPDGGARSTRPSQPPSGKNPARVHLASPSAAPSGDRGVIHDRGDDRGLPGQVQ